MTIRILNPRDWAELIPGYVFEFGVPEGDARTVKMEFNCSQPTALHLSWEDGVDADGVVEVRRMFLATITGWDKVEFIALQGATLEATSDGEVFYFTNDGQFNGVMPTQDNFVKLIGEQSRSEQIEQMLRLQTMRLDQLRQQQAQERAVLNEALERLAAAEAVERPGIDGEAADGRDETDQGGDTASVDATDDDATVSS